MDDFTKRMLEKAKLRREKLNTELAAVGDPKRRRVPLTENNPSTAPAIVAEQPKKVENIEMAHEDDDDDFVQEASDSVLRSRLTRLGKLYQDPENIDYSSPVHPRTETLSRFPAAAESHVPRVKSTARKARLDALAQNFKDWEDDYSKFPPTPGCEPPVSPVKIGGRAASPSRPQMGSQNKALFGTPLRTQSPVRAASPVRTIPSSPVRAASPVRNVAPASPVRAASPVRNMAPMSPVRAVSPVPKSPLASTATPVNSPRGPQMGVKSAVKNIMWDKAVLATLEAQGFVPTESKSCLVFDYKKKMGDIFDNSQETEEDEESFVSEAATPTQGTVGSPGWVYQAGSPVKTKMGLGSPVRAASPVRGMSPARVGSPIRAASPVRPCSPVSRPKNMSPGSVLQKAAMFESAAAASTASPTKDPAELSLTQRMALFEKNKTNAPLLPKVAFSCPLPAKLISTSNSKVEERNLAMARVAMEKKPMAKQASGASASDNLVQAHRALFEKSLNQIAKPSEVVAASQTERQKDLDMLRSRWDKQKQQSGPSQEELPKRKAVEMAPPSPPPMPSPSDSPSPTRKAESPKRQYPILNEVKKIRVSPPKDGRIYPSLSDIDATESEMDADTSGSTDHSGEVDDAENSFGDEILKAAGLNNDRSSIKRTASEMTESECAVLEDMDDFLEEALGNASDIASVGPTPPKKSCDRDASVFRTPAAKYIPTAPDTPVPSVNLGEGMVKPLTHTVSFYRRQQSQGSKQSTPVRQVYRAPAEVIEEQENPEQLVKEIHRKINAMQEQVNKQQIVISQASQALNLCRSTIEFSNSAEQVEAERLLLLATHKRQALCNEIQRLKVEGPQIENELDSHSETGSLTIKNLGLPLKREFLSRMRREENLEQYIVCLVKCQEQVLASTMMTTSSVPSKHDFLRFPGTMTLQNLKSNFAVTLEVYTLQARRETISHEDKYHIKKDNPKLRLTPKKHKHDNLLVMPIIQSPAGPSAVRSPSFALAGFTVFSLRELSRTQFTLNKVPYNSPLEGHIGLEMASELILDTEQRGFLTMFDDISGFGAWHRRWCVLDGARLSYWKYPDDEKKREPIGSIDLNECCSKQITAVSRDICARLNTFLIETQRASHPDDQESLVMIPGKNYTTIRHLISTDCKEERIQWCKELNHAITSMRAWKSCHKAATKGTAV